MVGENSEPPTHMTKDRWDKLDILLKPVGGIIAAAVTAIIAFLASNFLTGMEVREDARRQMLQEQEARNRLYSELMSRREQVDSETRKDMFKSMMESFLRPQSADIDAQLVNLELLAYNFHEFFDSRPLFYYMQRQIGATLTADQDETKHGYLARLERLARDITMKQANALEGVGKHFERRFDIKQVKRTPGSESSIQGLELDGVKRMFRVRVLSECSTTKELLVGLEVITPQPSLPPEPQSFDPFCVGFFDFPILDNIRLSNDQRVAVVLTKFENDSATIEVLYFPGWASLHEKPYYQEILERLKAKFGEGRRPTQDR